jgi:hypothetical protein
MYLIFPESMIIPEVAARREDSGFEDWLTAAVIENANRPEANGISGSARGITDLWMLEIGERTGKVWSGRFNVEFDGKIPTNGNRSGKGLGVFSFFLDTDSGEMTFDPELH